VTCKIGDKTAYLAEVKQAGIFGVAGFDEAARDAVLGSYCPNVLFPYARQAISDLVQSGGFPPFLLQPINFDALYAEAARSDLASSRNARRGDRLFGHAGAVSGRQRNGAGLGAEKRLWRSTDVFGGKSGSGLGPAWRGNDRREVHGLSIHWSRRAVVDSRRRARSGV